MKRRGDDRTLDLLTDWTPPEIAPQFSTDRVAGHTVRMRMARAYSEAIGDCDMSRDEVHAAMVDHMGQTFGRHTLDRCTAPSADAHEFTATKLIAFLHATKDIRVINALLRATDFVAIPSRYLGAIEEAMANDQIEQLETRKRLARRRWKGARA